MATLVARGSIASGTVGDMFAHRHHTSMSGNGAPSSAHSSSSHSASASVSTSGGGSPALGSMGMGGGGGGASSSYSPASTSSYAFESTASSSDAAHDGLSVRASPTRRPSAPEVVTGPDGALIVVEHVVALHDFQSSNATCLSFVAGQVIRVFNRDASGWWDGELDGQRGWFPSNYVDQGEEDEGGNSDSQGEQHRQLGSDEDHAGAGVAIGGEEAGTRAERGYERVYGYRGASANGRSAATLGASEAIPPAFVAMLDPIFHAIALLHNAVRANRVAHFQPSTACVISSVRSVLSATECLTRESPVLRAHPPLAKERKQILSILSRLVTQARKASAPATEESARGHEMESMLRHAELVLSSVKTFLDVAVQCGLKLPSRRSSVYDGLYAGGDGARGEDARETDKTPTPDSGRYHPNGRGGAGLAARSMVNLRGAAAKVAAQHAHTATSGMTRDRSGSASTDSDDHSPNEQSAPLTRSGSAASSLQHQPVVREEVMPVAVERTAAEVLQRLNVANDQLLSVIAAFIGHVHTHTRESHASSFAHLIDMTREAVDAVRGLLVVVEAVHSTAALQAAKPREMGILFETRESLYEATTQLVTAARVITGSPNPSLRAEDDEKTNLLQAATGVLRTGGECVGAIKLCIDRHDSRIRIVITEMVPQSQQEVDEDANEEHPTSRRRKNTLSYLGRKATSLNCLRDQYGSDGQMSGTEPIAESDTEEEAGSGSDAHMHSIPQYPQQGQRQQQQQSRYLQQQQLHQSPTRQPLRTDEEDDEDAGMRMPKSNSNRELTAKERTKAALASRLAAEQNARGGNGKPLPPTARARHGGMARMDSGSDHQSDGSEIMSRDHSRTSASSQQPSSTAETSARPSIDRRESDAFQVEPPTVPHTAPVNGRFPRDGPPLHLVRGIPRHGVLSEANSPVLSEPPASAGSTNAPPLPFKGRGRSGTLDPSAAWALDQRDQPAYMAPSYSLGDVAYNSDKQLIGATLEALVEKLTPHDTTVDPTFANAFTMCFRLFTTPEALFEAMIARYQVAPPAGVELTEEERRIFEQRKVLPVRLRVVNFLRNWLESHWQPQTDGVVLDGILEFAKTQEQPALQRVASRLGDLAQRRMSAGSDTKVQMMIAASRAPGSLTRVVSADQVKRDGALAPLTSLSSMYTPQAFPKNGPSPPAPILSKTLLSHLRQMKANAVNILDFDPLELARQLTVMESKLYCAILPEELLGQEFSKKVGVSSAVHVKAMSALSTHITGWISECILSEGDARKRRELLKFFIKLGDRCYSLNNFNSLMAIQCALNSSTISRLSKTWEGLNAKYTMMNEQQKRVLEHTRNFAEYRQKLRQTMPPALPFVGLFLTDLTFCHEGNAPTRASPVDPSKKLVNFDRYVKVSRIVGDLQRYQEPYDLVEVPEVQSYLRSVLSAVKGGGGGSAAEELYRRSLLLEPRSGDAHATTPTTGGGLGAKDIFNWKS